MSDDERTYWFPAKTYGWGWGLPSKWQGWLVLVVFLLLDLVDALVVLPRYGPEVFFPVLVILVAALIGVCWATGEPPRWRWGK